MLNRLGYETGIDLYKILDSSDLAEKQFIGNHYHKRIQLVLLVALSGVFSAFKKHVLRVAGEYNVDPRDIFVELGRRRVVGGQEDLIVEVAIELSNKRVKK